MNREGASAAAKKCHCPSCCAVCGARLRRDYVGHYCPTKNCQNAHGYKGCTLWERLENPEAQSKMGEKP